MKFKYAGDQFSFYPSRLLRKSSGHLFYSHNYDYGFRHFSDYWVEIGTRRSLVSFLSAKKNKAVPKGYRILEVMQKVGRLELGDGPGVVLYDINPMEISRFSSRMPTVEPSIFMEDVVIFPTKSKEAAQKLAEAIPTTLGSALAINEGAAFFSNSSRL